MNGQPPTLIDIALLSGFMVAAVATVAVLKLWGISLGED